MKCLTRDEEQSQAAAALRRSGYERGGRLKQEERDPAARDKRIAKKAVHQHEAHDHKGEPKTDLKLKHGGEVKGEHGTARLDKRARGGAMPEREMGAGAHRASSKGKGHEKPTVAVNIISPAAADQEKRQAAAAGLQAGAKMGAAAAARGMGGPPKPPMAPPGAAAGPPPGGAPAGGMPGRMPPGGMAPGGMPPGQPPMKRGGRLKTGGIC